METAAPLTSDEFSELIMELNPVRGAPVAVAVSGGADSLALTLMLGQWCQAHDVVLTALTVDHDLRQDSAAEAREVGRWLVKYHIPHVILKWNGDKPRHNIQQLARQARYGLMGQWCQDHNVTRLFLAHHQGDQAETFLIRLFRGSGVDGLAAMRPRSDYPLPLPGRAAVTICRPLLFTARARLEATLRAKDQHWIEDPSNHNQLYTRVKVRKLLQQNDIDGFTVPRMAQTAARMGRVQSLLKSLTDDLTRAAVKFFPEGYSEINPEILLSGHEEIILRCLAALIRRIGGGRYVPRLAKLEALYHRLQATDFAGQTLAGCLISSRQQGRIMISREAAAIREVIALEAYSATLWDGRFIIENGPVAGRVKKLEDAEWRRACQQNPDLEQQKLAKLVRDSLPCIITPEDRVVMADFLPGGEETGFCATFRQ